MNGLSAAICRHLAWLSLESSGLTSYCLRTSLRPHATPPCSLMSAAMALAICARSGRTLNVELPTGPASDRFAMCRCTSVGVIPGALALRVAHPAGTEPLPVLPEVPGAAAVDAPAA